MNNRIHPSKINIGSTVWQHGALIEVKQIDIYVENKEELEKLQAEPARDGVTIHDNTICRTQRPLPCYVVRGSFVEGCEKMFEYFRPTISAGEKCGEKHEYCAIQGNELAPWAVESL